MSSVGETTVDSGGHGERSTNREDRGVSEFTGVAILIAVTVLVTASVGLLVLVGEETRTGPPDANFSFQYIEQSSSLIVTYDRGDPVAAGNLTIRGQGSQAKWSVLAGANESTMIGPESPDATVQISRRNAFDQRVGARGGIRVLYVANGNETVLDTWSGR